MKIFKVVYSVLLLSSALLINFNNVKANEVEQAALLLDKEKGNLVSLGFIGNIEIKMKKLIRVFIRKLKA